MTGVGSRSQLAVELGDLRPIGPLEARRARVQGGDRRLQLVGPGPPQPQRAVEQAQALGDRVRVPARAVLVGRGRRLARRAGAGRPPRVVQQHQRQQAEHLGVVGHQRGEQPAEADRLGAQLGADERVALDAVWPSVKMR